MRGGSSSFAFGSAPVCRDKDVDDDDDEKGISLTYSFPISYLNTV